jgi:small subunit ribosomal protein S17
MADQPDNNDDETPDTPAAQDEQPADATATSGAAEGSTADPSDAADASAAVEPSDGADASAGEPAGQPAGEQARADQPADETGAQPQPQPQPTAPAEPAEQLSPKERRRKARSTHTGKAQPTRTPEERHAERVAERKDKAARRRARRLKERAKAASRRAAAGHASAQPTADGRTRVEGTRKVRQGIVVSDKADKSITVRIDVARRHRRYQKIVRSSSTLHAHDENNDAHEGDTVRLIESRPLSRTKHWRLVEVLERAR